ncbi:MAG: histidine ammonia-lyase [Legionellales bacterium]|nr:histidine ammonia-lyase [Legionellales bacterium]
MNSFDSNGKFIIKPGNLKLSELQKILEVEEIRISICKESYSNIRKSVNTVNNMINQGKVVYGGNTGFGKLANTVIETKDLVRLQHNLIASHCTGVGELVDDKIVKLISLLKVNSLARGYSGIREEVLELLLKLINEGYYPCIPCQGSVGASGDLAPLAHLSAPLIGLGYVRKNGEIISGNEALNAIGEKPLELAPLEGLSLLNGTQVSTAFALKAYFDAEQLMAVAMVSGAMSTDALKGSSTPFRDEIHQLRGQSGQIKVARLLSKLLENSKIRLSHAHCSKVQDPYSLRCQPQVMGACLDQLIEIANVLTNEINAVTNNPIVLSDKMEILSGGNFHAEPIAFAADKLAMIFCEIASMSERRISLLVDPNISQLPAFLINGSGLNSGFMIAQVTAAALVSENKSLSYPCSVDSIPTSANQEDHVSMATHAARRLFNMFDNTANVIAIELLSAAQGFDFLRPLESSIELEHYFKSIRDLVPFYTQDRYMADDIKSIFNFIKKYSFKDIKNYLELPSFLHEGECQANNINGGLRDEVLQFAQA